MCLLGAFTCWILLDYDTACFISSNYWFYWVVILAFPIVAALMACSDKLMKTSPLNIICLVIFSVMMAFMFAFLAGLWSTAGSNCGSNTFCEYFKYYQIIFLLNNVKELQMLTAGTTVLKTQTALRPNSVYKMLSVSSKLELKIDFQNFSCHRPGRSRNSFDLLFESYSHALRFR